MPEQMEGTSPEAVEANLAQLAANPYPGRFIAQGVTAGGEFVQAYAIMGRSESSRNRILEWFSRDSAIGTSTGVRTAPFVSKEGEDHSLTIYTAMREATPGIHVVTNGEQTDDISCTMADGVDADESARTDSLFFGALNSWAYEPDKPNWTPRINALLDPKNRRHAIEYMKKDPDSFKIIRTMTHQLISRAGVALCLHTYDGDGDPLPPFSGAPYHIPLGETLGETADMLWETLNEENRVALAVKGLSPNNRSGEIILRNKHLGD